MNKNKKRMLAMTLALGIMTSSAMSFAMVDNNDGTKVTLPSGEEVVITQYGEAQEAQPELYIADAYMETGRVIEIFETESGLAVLMEDENGQIIFHIDENTKLNVEMDEIAVGDTLEIFYDGVLTRSFPAQGNAIAVNKMAPVKYAVLDGEVMEVRFTNDEKTEGMIVVTQLDSENVVIFHFDELTKMNLDAEAIESGDLLHIHHSGAFMYSMPPQGIAFEISAYDSADIH